jgi:hypothetical protein
MRCWYLEVSVVAALGLHGADGQVLLGHGALAVHLSSGQEAPISGEGFNLT